MNNKNFPFQLGIRSRSQDRFSQIDIRTLTPTLGFACISNYIERRERVRRPL